MGLSTSFSIAQSALASAAAQSSVLSRNIGNVNTTGYTLKSANIVTTQNGASAVTSVQRATNTALFGSVLQAQSDSASQSAISNGLTQLQNTLGLNQSAATASAAVSATDQSPSTKIAALADALQAYASGPDVQANGTAVVTAATNLASSLNQASATVQQVRAQADAGIASSVQTLNGLLGQFQAVNQQIVFGKATGSDVTGAEDTRDSLLSQISNQVGITTASTPNGGTSIYTDSGVTLFDQVARQVNFTPTQTFTAATVGNPVTVDGLPITGSSAVEAVGSGAIAGLAQLRDTVSTNYQNQVDQISQSLISTFAESGADGTSPELAGLFTNGGSSAIPTATTGLAGSIAVNASVDPAQGGTVTLLRDGDVSGGNAISATPGAYTYNTTGAAAFADRLSGLVGALGKSQTFDSASGGVASGTLAAYASSSVSWLESGYQTASNAATYQSSLVSTATSALSNATGVNLDDQLSQMLDIEHAYQASAQLLNTVGTMYTALITALN